MDLPFFPAANMSPDALGLWPALGFLLLLVGGVVLLLIFEWIREKIFGPRKTLKEVKAETETINVAEITEGLCRLQGKVETIETPLVSPWGKKECVYYCLDILRGRFEQRKDYVNRPYTWERKWESEANDVESKSFMVSDKTGAVKINLGPISKIGHSMSNTTQIWGLRRPELEVEKDSSNWPRLRSLLEEYAGKMVSGAGRFERWLVKKAKPLDEMEAYINEVPLPDDKETFLCREQVLEVGDTVNVFGFAKRKKGELEVSSGQWPLIIRVKKIEKPSEEPAQVFVTREQEQKGPYSMSEVRRLLDDGVMLPSDLAFYQGLDNWTPLSQLFDGDQNPSVDKKANNDCSNCDNGYIRPWDGQERCWNCGHVGVGKGTKQIPQKDLKPPVDVNVLAKRRISRALSHPLGRLIMLDSLFMTLFPIISLGLTAVTVFFKIAVIIFLVLVVFCGAGLYHFFGPDKSKTPTKEPVTVPVKVPGGVRGKDANSTSGSFPGGLPGMGPGLPAQGK